LAPSAPPAVPGVTETLAELYRTQGYTEDAHSAYLELARTEPDPGRARTFQERAETLRPAPPLPGALAALGALRARFAAVRPEGPTELQEIVAEVVERAGGVTAVTVTDFEGVPVVDAGREKGSADMEVLSAELTAFWKGVRRSRGEVGEGAFQSLSITGSSGSVLMTGITSEYALIVKADLSASAGCIRYEAVRAAERLRPALL
jgi:predicted regulator of Ras-like GTPase activity (Roadblock/LC7/MglB family)